MRAMKKTVFTALAILMLLSLSVIPALAAVDVDAEGSITVSYKDMETDAPHPRCAV